MRHLPPRHIENPDAYNRAVRLKIQQNANTGRRRKLEAEIANDSEDFRMWLLGTQCINNFMSLELRAQYAETGYDDGMRSLPEYKQASKNLDAWWAKHGRCPQFLWDAMERWGGLTEKQLAFARKCFAENLAKNGERAEAEAVRRATAPSWSAGRQTIEGVVKSLKFIDGDFGTSIKGLVLLADGRKLWTSIPASLQDTQNGIKDRTVRMTVKIEVSQSDPTFANGSRPTKAEFV